MFALVMLLAFAAQGMLLAFAFADSGTLLGVELDNAHNCLVFFGITVGHWFKYHQTSIFVTSQLSSSIIKHCTYPYSEHA